MGDDIVDLASLSQTVGESALPPPILENQDQWGTPDIFQSDTHYEADNHLDNSVDLVNCLFAEVNDALNAQPNLDSEPAKPAAFTNTIEAGRNSNITGINYVSEINSLIIDCPRNRAQHDYKKLHTRGFSKIAKTVLQHGIIVLKTYKKAITDPQKTKWLVAMKKKYLASYKRRRSGSTNLFMMSQLFLKNGTLELKKSQRLNSTLQNTLGCQKLYASRRTRLQRKTCSCCQIRHILHLLLVATTRGWRIRQFDIKIAFLNSNMDRKLYTAEPQGYETGKSNACLLNKVVTDLIQTSSLFTR